MCSDYKPAMTFVLHAHRSSCRWSAGYVKSPGKHWYCPKWLWKFHVHSENTSSYQQKYSPRVVFQWLYRSYTIPCTSSVLLDIQDYIGTQPSAILWYFCRVPCFWDWSPIFFYQQFLVAEHTPLKKERTGPKKTCKHVCFFANTFVSRLEYRCSRQPFGAKLWWSTSRNKNDFILENKNLRGQNELSQLELGNIGDIKKTVKVCLFFYPAKKWPTILGTCFKNMYWVPEKIGPCEVPLWYSQ